MPRLSLEEAIHLLRILDCVDENQQIRSLREKLSLIIRSEEAWEHKHC